MWSRPPWSATTRPRARRYRGLGRRCSPSVEGARGCVAGALAGLAQAKQADIQFVFTRTSTAINGAAQATNAYLAGDLQMAANRHASALGAVGAAFAGTGHQVNATWQGLAGVYDAPEVTALLAATAPVQSVSASVGGDLGTAGQALSTYATEVREIQTRLAALRTQASAFVASVAGNEDWTSDGDEVERNRELIEAVNAEMAAFFEAQRRCANTINASMAGSSTTPKTATATPNPDNYSPFPSAGARSAPYCANCSALLSGVPSGAGLLAAQRDDVERHEPSFPRLATAVPDTAVPDAAVPDATVPDGPSK
ncbi:MAG: DUF6507 family protein [Pseudonocardiaceae bacterium]